jgi:TrmH family RNA methyltransferase
VRDGPLIAEFGRARRDGGLAVLEGLHAVKHALRFGAAFEVIATVDRERLAALAAQLAPDVAPELVARAREVDAEVFEGLVPLAPSTGVVAIAVRPAFDAGAALASRPDRPAVLLENPRDLGNLGAAVRVAAAADAAALVSTGTHDPWQPDALRGGAGLQFALPVGRVDSPLNLERSGRQLVALDPAGDEVASLAPGGPLLLAFGTERDGVSQPLLDAADARVRIPMREGVSSLNLATAVAATLYSLAR